MILVEIDCTNSLSCHERTIQMSSNDIYDFREVSRVRLLDDTICEKIPKQGIFWHLYPESHYIPKIIAQLTVLKEKICQQSISNDKIRMFYDVIICQLVKIKSKQINIQVEKVVWDTYGDIMLEHKENCEWVDMILNQGCENWI